MLWRPLSMLGLALVAGCGTSGSTDPGHWEGTASDASVDGGALASAWPTSDPDPAGAPHGAPSFGDAGAPSSARCAGKSGARGDRLISLTSNGLLRTSLLHVPPSYDPAAGAMLVLNFHGFSSNSLEEVVLARMNPVADARNFIVAYPEGIGASWNAGDCCGDSWTNSVDDVKLVKDLLAQLEAEYCIDPRRIYATGMSNGGFFSYRLACDMADTFAAVAPVAGAQGIPAAQCRPSRPVPVLQFHGTGDGVVPFNGGVPLSPINFGGPLVFRSASETTDIWRAKDGCLESGHTIYAKGDATCVAYAGCRGGSEVTMCTIENGGHTWPGGVPVPPLGKTSQDISATDTMVNFFVAHPMP